MIRRLIRGSLGRSEFLLSGADFKAESAGKRPWFLHAAAFPLCLHRGSVRRSSSSTRLPTASLAFRARPSQRRPSQPTFSDALRHTSGRCPIDAATPVTPTVSLKRKCPCAGWLASEVEYTAVPCAASMRKFVTWPGIGPRLFANARPTASPHAAPRAARST